MQPTKQTTKGKIKDHVIECKDILIRMMKKTDDIQLVRMYSKAIKELDFVMDLIDNE